MVRGLALAAVLLLALAAPASAHHVGCGDTITQDTTLDSDLTCPGDGLAIGASGVTLDLAGHAISGPSAGAVFNSEGVDAGQGETSLADVTIRRGAIRGFDRGISVDAGDGVAVRRLAITDNMTGVLIDVSSDVVIRRNVIAGNSGSGLRALDSIRLRVTGNDALDNAVDGIHLGGEVKSSVVEGNVASSNGDDGIEVFEIEPDRPNAVARNLATYNGDLGIEAVAGTVDGGGNRAFGNGNPLECLNIECK
jgi:hypothetical protein